MKNSFKKQFKEQKGVTLIMALLIMAGISATSLTLSIIIVNELMASKNTDEAIMAYYAAETGVEKGLYYFKANQDNPTAGFPTTGETLTNGAKIVSSSINQQSSVMTSLTKNQAIQLNLYDPGDLGSDSAKVDKLVIQGTTNSGQLETSYINWSANLGSPSTVDWGNADLVTQIYTETDLANGKIIDSTQVPFFGENPYHIIRFKALYSNIQDLKIEAFCLAAPPSCPSRPDPHVPIPTGFEIASSGEYGRAKQRVTANVPWQKTVNGLFNYVLFTKEELEKK